MYILPKKKKAILSFYSSYTHHIQINDFLIGLNAFEKKSIQPIAIESDEKEEEEKKEKKESNKSLLLCNERHLYTLLNDHYLKLIAPLPIQRISSSIELTDFQSSHLVYLIPSQLPFFSFFYMCIPIKTNKMMFVKTDYRLY